MNFKLFSPHFSVVAAASAAMRTFASASPPSCVVRWNACGNRSTVRREGPPFSQASEQVHHLRGKIQNSHFFDNLFRKKLLHYAISHLNFIYGFGISLSFHSSYGNFFFFAFFLIFRNQKIETNRFLGLCFLNLSFIFCFMFSTPFLFFGTFEVSTFRPFILDFRTL